MAPKRKARRIASPCGARRDTKSQRPNQATSAPLVTAELIQKAVSVVLHGDSVYIPLPLIGIIKDYAAPHDFKKAELGEVCGRLFGVRTDTSTGSAVLLVRSNGTNYSEYHVVCKRSVPTPLRYGGYAIFDFGCLYLLGVNAIYRVKMSDSSSTRFTFEAMDDYVIGLLPSTNPGVVYMILTQRIINYPSFVFLDRLKSDDAKSQRIASISSYSNCMIHWNIDRRLLSESEIWVTSTQGFVLYLQSIDLSNGTCRVSLKTPNSVRCPSSEIVPLSSGIVLFLAESSTDVSTGVYAIDPTTSEIEPIYSHSAFDAPFQCVSVHEPSRTLFFTTPRTEKIKSFYLPPHLFSRQECLCGC
jgi:hypothetical protein